MLAGMSAPWNPSSVQAQLQHRDKYTLRDVQGAGARQGYQPALRSQGRFLKEAACNELGKFLQGLGKSLNRREWRKFKELVPLGPAGGDRAVPAVQGHCGERRGRAC